MKWTYLYLSFHQKSKKCYRKCLFGKRVFCASVCAHSLSCFADLEGFFKHLICNLRLFLHLCGILILKTKYCRGYTRTQWQGGIYTHKLQKCLRDAAFKVSLIRVSYHKPKILSQTCMVAIKINEVQSNPDVKVLQYQTINMIKSNFRKMYLHEND